MHDVPKDIWTDDDFAQMGWHDSMVHAIGGCPEACGN